MLQEEKGSTLITVLLIIVVFSVIGLSLISLNVTNAKQGTLTRNNLQATNLAEMGTTHLKDKVYSSIKVNENSDLNTIATNLRNTLTTDVINKPFSITTATNSPKYMIPAVTITTMIDGPYELLTVDFTSVGTTENLQSKNITGKIILKRGRGFPSAPDNATVFEAKEVYERENPIYTQPVYYEQGLSMSSNTDVTVNVDLYAKGTITQASNTDLWVKGDAYVQTLDLKTNGGNGNLAIMCVDDTLYIYSATPEVTLPVETSFIDCATVLTDKPKNGIFAKKVVYLSINPEIWKKENLTIDNIQYQ